MLMPFEQNVTAFLVKQRLYFTKTEPLFEKTESLA